MKARVVAAFVLVFLLTGCGPLIVIEQPQAVRAQVEETPQPGPVLAIEAVVDSADPLTVETVAPHAAVFLVEISQDQLKKIGDEKGQWIVCGAHAVITADGNIEFPGPYEYEMSTTKVDPTHLKVAVTYKPELHYFDLNGKKAVFLRLTGKRLDGSGKFHTSLWIFQRSKFAAWNIDGEIGYEIVIFPETGEYEVRSQTWSKWD